MEKENKYFNSDTENIKENTDTESLEDSEEEDDEDTEKTPVSEMSDSEIIKLCISGENEEPKTVSCLALAEFVGDDISKADNPDLYRDISSRIISNAQTGIEPHDEFTFVTMKFKSALDPELKLIWSLLQNYGRLDSSLNREKPVVFSLSMVPNGYAGDVMLVFSNPVIWTLEPEVVGIAANNIVKMVFPTDRFCIADGEDLEDIDIDAAEAEVRREMAVVRQENR